MNIILVLCLWTRDKYDEAKDISDVGSSSISETGTWISTSGDGLQVGLILPCVIKMAYKHLIIAEITWVMPK